MDVEVVSTVDSEGEEVCGENLVDSFKDDGDGAESPSVATVVVVDIDDIDVVSDVDDSSDVGVDLAANVASSYVGGSSYSGGGSSLTCSAAFA